MRKKIKILSTILIFLFVALPLFVLAKGLVPCGGEGEEPCNLCYFFVLISKVISFLSIDVAIPLVAIMAIVSAILFITAHGNPQQITRARQTITATVIGYAIVLGAWIIVNTIVVFATGNSAGTIFGRKWNEIQCGGGQGTSQGQTQNEMSQSSELPKEEVEMAENMQEAESKGNYSVYGVDSRRNREAQSISEKRINSLLGAIFGWGRSIYRTTPLNYYPEPQHVDYPTNLGVQNARFGSRLNLNFHFDPIMKKVWSSTMGAEIDSPTSFIVATRLESNKSVYRFPPSSQNYPEKATLIEVLPDRQRIYGYHPDPKGNPLILTSIATVSPFSPTRVLDDSSEDFKLSIAPLFYNEIALYNTNYNNDNLNDDEISGQLLVAIDYFKDYKQVDYKGGKIKFIYYQTPEDNGGIRTLAIWDPQNLVTFGYGDGVFDHFRNHGSLPCDTNKGENYSGNCKIGGSKWNPGAFAISFKFEKKDKWGDNLPEEEKEKAIVFIYAGYNGGEVMKDEWGNSYKFYYTKLFKDVNEVVEYGIRNFDVIIKKTTEFSNNIRGGDGRVLNINAQWILSQALHSYFANTWLLYNPEKNDVHYYVAEGRCNYLSTVDVAHETAIFEAEYIPWVLKLQLSEWAKYAKYDKNVGKMFLQHDMGQQPPKNFINRPSPIPNVPPILKDQAYIMYNGYGAMPIEENLNFILIAYRYWKKTGDIDFIKNLKCDVNNSDNDTSCIESFLGYIRKKDVLDGNEDGLIGVTFDNNGNPIIVPTKVRADITSEAVKKILAPEVPEPEVEVLGRTTFDCCGEDFLLSHENGNVYIAIKTFAASIAARELALAMGNKTKANIYLRYAEKINEKLNNIYNNSTASHEGKTRNFFILSLDKSRMGWASASIAVFDGLTYLALDPPQKDKGLFKNFINKYVTPLEGALLFAWVKGTDRYAYRLVGWPDVNRSDFDYCCIDKDERGRPCSQKTCFSITWLSKTFNTNTILKYSKASPWEIFTNDSYVKAKNLLQKSSMAYQDAWNTVTGKNEGLDLYPRGVSVIGQKFIK